MASQAALQLRSTCSGPSSVRFRHRQHQDRGPRSSLRQEARDQHQSNARMRIHSTSTRSVSISSRTHQSPERRASQGQGARQSRKSKSRNQSRSRNLIQTLTTSPKKPFPKSRPAKDGHEEKGPPRKAGQAASRHLTQAPRLGGAAGAIRYSPIRRRWQPTLNLKLAAGSNRRTMTNSRQRLPRCRREDAAPSSRPTSANETCGNSAQTKVRIDPARHPCLEPW